ncbi:MAG: type I DNA topoisomerase [Patescibacteria group bacterium]
MNLLIVESPTKAKTIQRFLEKDFTIRSTMGHIRDLPKSTLGVDTAKNFEPHYVIPRKAKKKISELKREAARAEKIILATDEDREGEAIAWHLVQILDTENKKQKKGEPLVFERIAFHEITPGAIKEALRNPRQIDIGLVNAQQARRVLDRLVGYKLSPLLWRKIKRGLSAGRVQSVAVRLICDREKEIRNFKPQEYWTIEGLFLSISDKEREILARLFKKDGRVLQKLDIKSKEETEKIVDNLRKTEYQISKIETSERLQNPLPPFTTSLLQQEAWQKFHFPAKFTMGIAQSLYEQGFITYHRTDSFNLSNQSLSLAQKIIENKYGKEYWAGYFRLFKTRSKSAQEAHEAIRPTFPDKDEKELREKLKSEQYKLYELIWKRFIASQMAPAKIEERKIIISSKDRGYEFIAEGKTIKFEGFLRVYPLHLKERYLPELSDGENLTLREVKPLQHFTQPPKRYNEGTLIKTLERHGIGRPSTYAPIISTVLQRGYVEKDGQRRLKSTDIGETVNNLLVSHFSDVVNISFTAKMEDNLDDIAAGKIQWQKPIGEFYHPFEENLIKKESEIKKETGQETEEPCPKCGKKLVVRWSRYGKFLACPGFPKCKFTKSLDNGGKQS